MTQESGTSFSIELQPEIPLRLARLDELANDLYYSWDRHSRGLFYYLDKELWEECRHNPKVFLRRISQKRLEEVATDRAFLEEYQRTLANYDTYHEEIKHAKHEGKLDHEKDLLAYFCAEFGLHESLPVYSGGLGILAGDYCKAASDLGLPFVAVGILYRQGNATQTIDDEGHQITHYLPVELDDLLIKAATDRNGNDIIVNIALPDTTLYVKVWQAKAGHTKLVLLDTDLEQNNEMDRAITFELYPADRHTRLKQEIVLGIGGVRALRQLGLSPTVWHINEGHPCLLLLERWHELVSKGMEFPVALQFAAANTVFTTHTPITAGHEVFDADMIGTYLSGFIDELGIDIQQFMRLGQNEHKQSFNLTGFSLRCSRFHNGVSRIHGDVAGEMEQHIWPQIPVDENPIGYVTNGIHVPTFLAREWFNVLDDPGLHNELLNPDYWSRIDDIPDATFWSTHFSLKSSFLKNCIELMELRCKRHGQSQAQIDSQTEIIKSYEDVLVIGFARRFATYKRADLLFDDTERLQRLLSNRAQPVIFMFAGKSHPHDEPGKQLIKRIHDLSLQPEFHGKIILLEGYDMALARKLVACVDVWLNTPEYPMEASGTSGMKAGINGVINFSILDGWWAEGYNGHNGWAIQPHKTEMNLDVRRKLEAKELLDILEYEVIPMYFDKGQGYSEAWVKMSKESMKSIIPRFNSQRMAMDYVNQFYLHAISISNQLEKNNYEAARQLTKWKLTINKQWSGISIRRTDTCKPAIKQGEELVLRVNVKLNGLKSQDIHVECILSRTANQDDFESISCHPLKAIAEENEETVYECRFVPDLSGLISYKLRAYPYHPLLCHPFEMGYLLWL
jgi:glycogen phosphorylase